MYHGWIGILNCRFFVDHWNGFAEVLREKNIVIIVASLRKLKLDTSVMRLYFTYVQKCS